jgi:hypothetical protein
MGSAARDALAQKPDASTVIAQAREALGGDKRLASVKSFIATGRTRQVRGDNLVPIEFEIVAELPDKYARRDEFPAQDAGPSTSGFSGDTLIQMPLPPTPPARPGGPPPPTPAQVEAAQRSRVATLKQDFGRLMLGLFASTPESFPITFTYVGEAEAPQGKAVVLDAKGPASFSARLFVDSQTHLPIMVSWQQPAGPPGGRGAPPQRGGPTPSPSPQAPSGQPPSASPPSPQPSASQPGSGPASAAAAPAQPANPAAARGVPGGGPGGPALVEHRLYFADYRDVDGLKWPFRLRHAVAGDTIEETTFDRYRINARIDPKRFETAR